MVARGIGILPRKDTGNAALMKSEVFDISEHTFWGWRILTIHKIIRSRGGLGIRCSKNLDMLRQAVKYQIADSGGVSKRSQSIPLKVEARSMTILWATRE